MLPLFFTMKPIFLHGLGKPTKKELELLTPHFNVVDIDWNNGSLAKLKLGKPDMIVAFSLGCEVACMHAEKNKVKRLVLCSPSPQETLKNIMADRVDVMVGCKESEWMFEDCTRLFETSRSRMSVFHSVVGAQHKIDKIYLESILEVVDN